MLPALINIVCFALAFHLGMNQQSPLWVPLITLGSWAGYVYLPSGVRGVLETWDKAGKRRHFQVLVYLVALPLVALFHLGGTLLSG